MHWLNLGSHELLERLRVLNGFDIDLTADQTRLTNRCRDALTSVSPVLERALGSRLNQAGVRDLLAKYPTPTLLRGAGQVRITSITGKPFESVQAIPPSQCRATRPSLGGSGEAISMKPSASALSMARVSWLHFLVVDVSDSGVFNSRQRGVRRYRALSHRTGIAFNKAAAGTSHIL